MRLLTRFGRRDFLEQMLCKDDQVLHIHDAVAEWGWADVAERVVRTPAIDYHAHVDGIDYYVWDAWGRTRGMSGRLK